ncbi:hypothetical protein TorRG33x02_097470, partial [Trema orientale]
MEGAGIDEVDEAGAAVELGEEESGVGLGLRGFDPLEAGSDGATLAAPSPEDSASIAAQSHGILIFVWEVRKWEGKCGKKNWIWGLGFGFGFGVEVEVEVEDLRMRWVFVEEITRKRRTWVCNWGGAGGFPRKR